MPPLRLFNRSWHISSDDLVLPAWMGVAFHGTWTSLIAAEVIIIGLPDDCAGKHLATSSVLWLLISFALTTVLQLAVAGISMRGAMLQEYKRAVMPTALYCLLSAYLLEAAALVYATIVNFGVLADTIGTCHTADELARTSISELSLHRWFLGSTWGMLFAISGLLVLMYNLYPDRGLESWEKRVNCMSYILCCRKSLTADADGDTTASSAPTVVRLARVFGDLFYPLNFSFTDTVAAITLVGITHRSSAHGHGSSSHNHALIAAAGAGVLSAAKHEAASMGAGALLEAAVAAAAAREAKAAAELAIQNSGKQNGAGQALVQAANGTGAAAAADDSVAGTPSQQDVQLADRTASSAAAAPGVESSARLGAPAASPQRSPSPGSKGMKHSSSTGNAQAALIWGSSATSLGPSPVSCARSASNSAWEAAVRQGSALAVAPGQGFVPGAGPGSRAASPAHDTGALPARSQSTAVDSTGTMPDRGTSPSRFNYRAQSWGGSAGGSSGQQVTGRSSEQGTARPQGASTGAQHISKPQQTTLSSLAEANELSLAHSNVLGQVESLLSPLASSDSPGVAAMEGAVEPPSGSAAAGDAVGAPAAVAAMLVNPLFSDRSAQQQGSTAGIQAAGSQGGMNSGAAGALAAAAASAAVASAAGELVVTAAAKEVLGEAGAQTSDGQPVSLELLEEALHWHAYANAIYGWPMFLWSHRYRVLRCCRLCCGGCCKGVPHSPRSSGGGLGISTTVTSASSKEEGTKAMDSKPGSFANSNDSGRPVTAVVTMSSVDTDSVSPASTSAGGTEATGTSLRQETGRPVAEAVELSAAEGPAHPHADAAAAAASGWDVEQGGSEQQAAAAQERGTKGVVRSSIGARSRRWVQSSGNIWLLQGLADALGISRESAVRNAVAPGAEGPAGRQPRLSSATGGLWADEGACGCLCGGKWGASHVPKMAPLTASQRLTNEAIMQTANIPAADLLYVNYNNLVEGLLPYSVVLDAARRCVVVAIRGSLSVEDCVTDILYDPAPLDQDWLLQQPAPEMAAAAEPCQPPAQWPPQEATAATAQVGLTAGDMSFQQQQEQLDWPPAPALEAALQAAAAGAPVPSRPMLGDSSAGGSFRSTSMKASPFASAAAAASVAARNSSTGAEALAAPPMAPSVPQPSPPQAQQLQSGLSRMPSVPAAQAAAAAAAAAGQPLPAGGRTLKRHWSVNFSALQQQQQQQQLGAKLSEQPSFMRRVGSSLKQRHQDGEQQQQLTQRPSVLESALSVLLGPWRRLTGSDTGDGYRHKHQDRADAAVAAEEGRVGSRLPSSHTAAGGGAASKLSSFKNRATGSTDHSQEPGSGSNSPKRLFKTFSLNLATAVGAGGKGAAGQQQQQGPNVRRRTTSSRMLAGAREQGMLQSYASEHIPSTMAPSRRSTADSWRQSQTRRTTAADRALGAARAGHRYAPMTSPATDQSAAAAAASHRSFMQQVHHQQQQQQRQQALSNMPSMRSTAPASTEPSVTAAALAAAAAAGSAGAASEPGLPPSSGHAHAEGSPFKPWSAAAAAGEGRSSGDAQGSPKDVRSRRSTFTQLPRINSGAGAMGDLQEPQQQQLAMMASVPAALLSQQQQQQQQGDARQRPASDDGGSVGGSVASSTGRRSLRSSVSDMAWRARQSGQSLLRGHQQQPQQLQDGGPTDWSLLAGAATMVPSRTAAVPQQAAGVPASAGGRLMKSYSVNLSSRPGTGAGQSPLLSMSYSARPPIAPYSAGTSVASSAAAGSAGDSSLPDTVSSVAGEAASAQAHSGFASPFMQQQQAAAELEAELSPFAAVAAAAAGRPLQLESPWALQPLLDSSAEVQQDAAAAAADAEEAALADEVEAAAAAEADAAAAAAQAAAAEETPDTGAAGAQWFAHEGILNCARAIRDDLDRLGLLDQLLLGSQASTGTGGTSKQQQDTAEEGRFMSSTELPDCRGWTLMLTGHSLGAGVAALLALHYRARYTSVRAWCFAPPGGLMSPAAAASLKDICYSLVSAKDMIPRMSLWTIERLRDEMMICALRCKMPKYKLLLGAAFGRKWEEGEVLRPLEELSDAEIHAFQDYRHAVVEERSLDPLRVRIAREFVPPGEVLWLERNKQLQPRLRVPNTTLNACPTAASAVSTAWDAPATAATAAPIATARATDVAAELQPNGTATAAVQGTESSQARGLAAASSAVTASRGSLSAAAGAASGSSSKAAGSTSMLRGGSAALEAAAVAVAGKRVVSRLQPHVTDGLGIIVGGMVVSRNMFADHVPDKQLYQLKRLVRYLKRQQALGRPLPQGIAPVVVAQPPLQQGMPSRRM